jgi:sec-independent protein translocase protein TatB
MNFGFSGEMIFIFFLALILFGPKKMPEIGRQVARFLGEFRRASNEFRSQIESEINNLDNSSHSSPRQQILPPFQAPLGSLASRILNPPPPEEMEAAEDAAAKAAAAELAASKNAAAEAVVTESTTTVAVDTGFPPNPEPAPKAAPDA